MGLAAELYASLGAATRLGVKPCVLTRVTPGVRLPGAQSAGTNPTTTLHACKAFVGMYKATQINETTVKSEDRVICIFAASILPAAVPEVGDRLEIDGSVYRIVADGLGVTSDAAGVLYSCHARGQ